MFIHYTYGWDAPKARNDGVRGRFATSQSLVVLSNACYWDNTLVLLENGRTHPLEGGTHLTVLLDVDKGNIDQRSVKPEFTRFVQCRKFISIPEPSVKFISSVSGLY